MNPPDEQLPELSIVIPCFNEVENVAGIVAAVDREAARYAYGHEIVLIDNASTDGTREAIRAICATNPRVWAIFNNRNYGQMRSPTYGIYQARGRAVIGMCADFQDPPEMIGEFVRKWREGAMIVMGQRRSERSGALLTLARRTGYALLGRIADYPVIPDVTGFGLFDRRVVDTLAQWQEPEPFFRGMVVESGFSIALVPFDRPERAAGTTKNGLRSLMGFALSGLAGSAKALLRVPIVLALLLAPLALVLLAFGLVGAVLGWAATLFLVAGAIATGMFAVLMLFVGLIGDQVRLLTERTRHIPLVIEECRVNDPRTRAA